MHLFRTPLTAFGCTLQVVGLSILLSACGGGGGSASTPPPVTPPPTLTSSACQDKWNQSGSDIVLLAGQSNMVGYGAYYNEGFDLTDPRILQLMMTSKLQLATEPLDHPNYPYNIGRVGPGLAFGREYLKDLPSNRNIILVPAAQGGTGFSDNRWNPGDDLFRDAVSRTRYALDLNPQGNCLVGILWSQGEVDAFNQVPEAEYKKALDTMITTMRQQLAGGTGTPTAIPFVLGQFSRDWTTDTPLPEQQAILNVINSTPARLPHTAIATTEGLTSNLTQGLSLGSIHFDAASQRIYGKRFREALKTAAK